ncbi:Acyl-CoA synthetase (AMP-forming)/AMP-acid ligase II [Thermomonospora echinospora]|uniref:Acyl-CoA synthetase (AMP-forming)/AMP-acid ligase II n=1 Tax=Thermomonospora echinospora TaxID=1992 RepID=A0A1H6B387_9ACTN|nr:non-ribosomal peptide synthetase [Thermomonospora echinospora]SEG55082.1 Acyl-CoA synthetase (AMP-forming)/AMP-acid ligase II [Thermomonospora echinospora]
MTSQSQTSPAGTVATGGIAGLLLRAAATLPPTCGVRYVDDGGAVAVQSYADLRDLACRLLAGLRDQGLRPGDPVALLLDRPHDVVPAFWACVLGGFVPCPMAPMHGDAARWAEHLEHVAALLDDPLIVTSEAVQRDLPPMPGRRVVRADRLPGAAAEPEPSVPGPDDVALLMLTSGSTGASKAVALTHGNLRAALAAKAERLACLADDVMMNWIAFDHIAAFEGHLLPMSVGAAQVQVQPQFILTDPVRFLRLAAEHRVTLSFAPNFLFGEINKALGEAAPDGPLDLSALRRVLSGGEAVVCATARRFLNALAPYGLRRQVIVPAFGMTETCAGSTMNLDFPDADAGEEFASLGPPIPGLDVRIADERDLPVPAGAEGELQVRGPMVFSGYYRNPAATAGAFTRDRWFRTGDRGRLDDGRLRLTGRSKDSVIVNGVNYFSHELETALGRLPEVEAAWVAAVPIRPPGGDTEQLAVMFAPAVPMTDEAGIHQALAAIRNTVVLLWGFRPALILPLPKPDLPKTSLGKIQRTLLRERLEAGRFADRQRWIAELTRRRLGGHVPPGTPTERAVAAVYADLFQLAPDEVSATAGFLELGGTSLDVLRLQQRLRRTHPHADLSLASILRAPTVRALAALLDGSARPGGYDPIVPLQLTGDRTPLFCVHPGVGEVLVFVNLAAYFTGERPFYALRARGFGPGERHFADFGEMVSCYVAAIRRRRPTGPYAIAGYSYGGAVAYEIARTLEAQGQKVGFAGIINLPPHIKARMHEIDFTEGALHLALFLDLITPQQTSDLAEPLRGIPADRQLDHIMAIASPRRLTELNLDRAGFAAWVDLAQSLIRAGRSYEPTGSVASLSIFYADPLHGTKQDWLDNELHQWDAFTRGENRYIEVPGAHYTLMNADHVGAFQQILRRELARTLHDG